MDTISFKVSIGVREAYDILKKTIYEETIHEEFHSEGNKQFGVIVFEKYYMRSSNRASLSVIVHNFSGETQINAVPSGSSQGMLFRFDWGAGNNFANKAREALEEYVL